MNPVTQELLNSHMRQKLALERELSCERERHKEAEAELARITATIQSIEHGIHRHMDAITTIMRMDVRGHKVFTTDGPITMHCVACGGKDEALDDGECPRKDLT